MNNFFNRTNKLFLSQQKSIFTSAFILALMILIARFFGFLRYRVFANFFTKEQLDIFFASFRFPDLIFELLMTGAFTSCFIPIYLKYSNDQNELSKNISSIINFMILLMFVLISFLFIFSPLLIGVIMPGFNKSQVSEVIFYTRILLVSQLPFLILGNILISIGQANRFFIMTSVAPIIYNLLTVVFVILFARTLRLDAPVFGVVLGSLFFFLSQLWVIFKTNYHYQLILQKTEGLKEFIKISIPRILTVFISQIDVTIDLSLSTLLGIGNYTIFYLAQHLQLLPVSVVGLSFGQAALPYLSEMVVNKKYKELSENLAQSVLNIIYLVLPISLIFIFARTPLIRLFFGGQKFDWSATVQTAITLSFFAISIPFHSIYYLIVRAFYSFLDTKTPFIFSSLAILLNTLLSLIFVIGFRFPVWSLAISFSFTIILNTSILFLILTKKVGIFKFKYFISELLKIGATGLFCSFSSFLLLKLFDKLILDTTRTINIFFLLGTVSVFFLTQYFLLSYFLNIKEIYLLIKLINKIKDVPKKIFEAYLNYE